MLPSPDILNDFPEGKFVLSNLAAKRAKQLRDGAPQLVRVDSTHPLTIALAEIAAGKIRPILAAHDELEDAAGVEMALISDEPLPAELGMLLPALDETEVALVASDALHEDHDLEPDVDAIPVDLLSLADLGAVDGEESTVVASEEDTLSLSDIAEQETSLEDDETEV